MCCAGVGVRVGHKQVQQLRTPQSLGLELIGSGGYTLL
jgi:hypothetical protein